MALARYALRGWCSAVLLRGRMYEEHIIMRAANCLCSKWVIFRRRQKPEAGRTAVRPYAAFATCG